MVARFNDNLTGRTFTRWTVLQRGDKHKHWLCRCVCGTMREVLGTNLRNGASRSCGCLPKGHVRPSRQELHQRYIDSVVESIKDSDEGIVAFAAFQTAQATGASIVDCYLSAVRAIHRLHPECAREYAGKRAVAIILESRMTELIGRSASFSLRSRDEENCV